MTPTDLRRWSRPHHLALWLVPPDRRALALALFALERELAEVPTKVREPTLGLMRIVWWRNAVLALADAQPPAQPILQVLAPFRDQAATIADWAETFDAPFLPADEQAERWPERRRLAAQLLGPKAADYLAWAAAHPHTGPLQLAWRALVA